MDIALVATRHFGTRYAGRVTSIAKVKSPIIAWMFIAITTVTALAYWDEQRESRAALADFAREQVALAESLAASLEEKLATIPLEQALQEQPGVLLAPIRAIEHKGLVRVLLARPDQGNLVGSEGEPVDAPSVTLALSKGARWTQLSRETAAALGLPERTAIAALQKTRTPALGEWAVAVIVTAQAERDRELRAQRRLLLGVTVASGLVVAFGGLALRKQRQELAVSHQLTLTRLRNEGDDRLVRADKLATMGALAMGIAHEVSTPLGVILGRAEQLLPRQSDERTRRAVETITQQTERIFEVIRGFLTLARGDEPALDHCDPGDLARAAVGLVEHRFEKAGVTLRLDTATGVGKLACQARLLEQVLVNLLLNACDACERGGTVSLSVHGDEQRIAFVVDDNGVGIGPEIARRATEPFFTTKPVGQGTGVGLAIANEIVKHHRGSLTLVPGLQNIGTRVTVDLPAVEGTSHG